MHVTPWHDVVMDSEGHVIHHLIQLNTSAEKKDLLETKSTDTPETFSHWLVVCRLKSILSCTDQSRAVQFFICTAVWCDDVWQGDNGNWFISCSEAVTLMTGHRHSYQNTCLSHGGVDDPKHSLWHVTLLFRDQKSIGFLDAKNSKP